jgi:multiple sugar transport system ATP-binding protein
LTAVSIALEQVTKVFANGRVAVRNLTLEIGDGELLVLVGPSGCGKSTVLRLIAGLETPTSGRIVIDGRDMTGVPPNDRDLAMVFQSYALYPHKTVADNLAFGLRMRGVDPTAIKSKVVAVAAALRIEPLLDLKPAQLSGGQRQRVALGRAIVREPRAFLLDEPLSNLDPQLRADTRAELGQLHRRLRATMIHVTHDQEEAMTLGDRIAVLRDGAAEQIAPPLEVYRRPVNAFVATFVGSPKMNLLDVAVMRRDGRLAINGPGFSIDSPVEAPSLDVNAVESRAPSPEPSGVPVQLGIRARDVALVKPGHGDAVARIDLIEPLGHEAIVRARIEAGGPDVTIVANADEVPASGDSVGLSFRRDRLHLFRSDDGGRVD